MNNSIIIITVVAFVGGLLSTLRYRWFVKKIESQRKNDISAHRKSMLPEEPSYSQYTVIAARTSIRNRTVRQSGDFLDFFLSFGDNNENKQTIEARLSMIDCGEIYE